MLRSRLPTLAPLFASTVALSGVLAAGCAAPASQRDVLHLAAVHADDVEPRHAQPERDSVELRAARIARLRQALLDGVEPDPALAAEIKEVIEPHEGVRDTGDTPPPELVHLLLAQVAEAETLEPEWNKVHYACGYALGLLGFSREASFDILDGWERFEHDSTLGRKFGLSMQEGAFGYLWDLEVGMAGYTAAVAYLRGEGRQVSDDIVAWRRGGYSN